ncbi:hypothetical protein MAN_00877, partial [Metarhizium hybridum]
MDKVYTKSLHSVGFGRPLYHAAPNLQPGHCGYFDTNGHWHLIIDLSNHLSKDSKLVTEPPVQLGPVYGETMKWTKCNAEAEIRIGNLPPKAGFSLGFKTTKSECGLLLTAPVQYRAYEPDEPFRAWIKEHGRDKVSELKFDDPVSDYGLFLVTQVYCTTHCKIAAVLGADQELSVQCTASALDGQKLSGKGNWGVITGAGISQEFKAQDGIEYTVFAGGWWYKPSWVFWPIRPFNPIVLKMPEAVREEVDRTEERCVGDETMKDRNSALEKWTHESPVEG